MIDKMTKYSFILLSADKEGFLQTLQDLGLVDVTSSNSTDITSSETYIKLLSGKQRLAEIEAGSDAATKELEAASPTSSPSTHRYCLGANTIAAS